MELSPLYNFDQELSLSKGVLIGTDEAGRGPLAGPVVCAAVILDLSKPIIGIDDSKKLSEKKRNILYPQILSEALSVSVAVVPPSEIDTINILQASLIGMFRSINKAKTGWDHVLVDGNKNIPQLPMSQQQYVIKGDSKSASIAAASIVAKVLRDKIMRVYDSRYPHYGFAQHKGYPTKMHRNAVVNYGLTPIHRTSFCSKLVMQTSLFSK